jgi:hypothetical protein
LRHANISTTLEIYTHAGMDSKLVAQLQMMEAISLAGRGCSSPTRPATDLLARDAPRRRQGLRWSVRWGLLLRRETDVSENVINGCGLDASRKVFNVG